MPSCMQIYSYFAPMKDRGRTRVHLLPAISFILLSTLHFQAQKMARTRSLKLLQICLLLLAFISVGFLIFSISAINPFEKTKKPWISKANSYLQDSDKSSELVKVLRKAARMDRTVILTTLAEAWASPNSIFDLFLESFRIGEGTSTLLRHLVIIAMDQRAFDRCRAVHSHCLSMVNLGLDFSAQKRWTTRGQRIGFQQSVLELGYHFVFTDVDVMWLRNPFSQFTSGTDIVFSGEISDWTNRANGGFYYVRSSALTVEFYKYWCMAGELYTGLSEQDVFNIVKEHSVVREIGLRIESLDPTYFGGFCQQTSADMNRIKTMHANCCVGVESKLNDLRLVLEDWRNFTALSTVERKNKGVSWRAPRLCKQWK